MFEAAGRAGVGRIIPFSVANASVNSRLPYFRENVSESGCVIVVGIAAGLSVCHTPARRDLGKLAKPSDLSKIAVATVKLRSPNRTTLRTITLRSALPY